mmetsp:Transcript_4559/g.5268  ORF Transcript_4559/g.5268 Transcript_4559/m.5268 type:complete len:100 (+) Transcript_4559:86-385(+)|eukprot:CAMPEP_0198262128 /NCGR_PEP_ID=MMETSP1447-20131203/10698_1 /TAXON_ID=420782 /ORGANISM="Chaetoceros dichaeta, Strain CCMP1751" /LENGTH=99 /DNA_ID=CAMNT_0043950261 /DNA_START=35 /DNA_END=334 /DNA_ORIENTATION=-
MPRRRNDRHRTPAGEELVERAAIQLLQTTMELTSSDLRGLEPPTKQMWYWLETTPDGLPRMRVLEGAEWTGMWRRDIRFGGFLSGACYRYDYGEIDDGG